MASADQFDILLQFQQPVMQDLQHRILNASPLTTLWVKSPLSRRIEQPVPPLEVKACWNSPNVTVSDGGIKLSADLNGGARQILSGRILTLDGTVSAQQMVTHAVDSERRPYVCVKAPTAVQVNLRQLKVSYEGSRWPELLAKLNPAKEATALRPVLAAELFGQLACIPLTCMPYSLPVSAPDTKRGAAVGTLPIKRVVPGLFATPASVALGLMLDDKRAAPASFAGVLLPQSRYNTAIAFSEQGLNALLTHLCDQGDAMGQVQHTRLGKIEWRWEKLHVTLRQDVLAISGLLVQQGVKLSVVADVKSKLVNNGCVQSHLVSGNVDANAAETLLASWNGVLKLLLRSRAANKRDQDARDAERLFQCFDLPASKQTVETVAQELVVSGEQLIIYYTIPKSVKEFPLEFPPPKPAVTITQPHMPQQAAPVAPVTIELDARITRDSTPPYDYAWTNDLSPNPVPQFGSKYTISSVPLTPAIGEGLQTLTTAHLKVIDMFGQVSEAQAPAQYLPYTKQKRQQNSVQKGAGIGSVLFFIVVLLRVLSSTHILPHLIGGGGGNYTIQTTIAGEAFSIQVGPGHACQTRDTSSQPVNRNYVHPGKPRGDGIFFKTVFQCSGTYGNGHFSYTETVTADEIDSTLNTEHCYPTTPFVYIQLNGTVSGGTVMGTYTWNFPSCNYDASSAGLGTSIEFLRNTDGGQGSGYWTGQVTSA